MKRKTSRNSHSVLIPLAMHEFVVTAYAENARGPGWSNTPIWVIIENGATGEIRKECLQPEQQTEEMHRIYAFCELAHSRLLSEVTKATR
jgi:hypothetical protein